MNDFKWGIVATGNISNQFCQGVEFVEGAKVEAVVSRDLSKAKAFGEKYGASRYYDSYAAMAESGDLDCIYIGTPNHTHFADTMFFLEAGFNVLCEKPLGANAKQVEAIIAKAKEKNVFFLEGMWTRFFPTVKQSLKWIQAGRIGEVQMVHANFGLNNDHKLGTWRFRNDYCGGALLDVGIYPLCMAFAVLGTDFIDMNCFGKVYEGVDVQNVFTLKYDADRIANLSSAFTVSLDNKVVISGSKGSITIGEGFNWWQAKKTELKLRGDSILFNNGGYEVFEDDYPATGFQYEAKAVQDYIKAGKKQADEFPWAESITVAKTMDALREKMGVVYAEDSETY